MMSEKLIELAKECEDAEAGRRDLDLQIRRALANLEDAKTAFKAAWERVYEALTPDDIEHWHRTADGADRFGR
jgi:hypothetical protein